MMWSGWRLRSGWFRWALAVYAISGIVVIAADPPWISRTTAEWDQYEAKVVLTSSPWAGTARVQRIPGRSPSQRRESGDWDAGAGPGLGLAELGVLIGRPESIE